VPGYRTIGYFLMLEREGHYMNVWSQRKRLEKITDMPNNPVKRR